MSSVSNSSSFIEGTVKKKINDEAIRRSGGSGGVSVRVTATFTSGETITASDYNNLIAPLRAINSNLIATVVVGGPVNTSTTYNEFSEAYDRAIEFSNKTNNVTDVGVPGTHDNGCASMCTGLCSSTCYGGCTNGCLSGCKGTCKGGCQGTCNTSCLDGCYTGCYGTCEGGCGGCSYETCEDNCGGACSFDCGGGCSSGCSGTSKSSGGGGSSCYDCTAYCANGCGSGCANACGDDCGDSAC